MCDLQYYSCTNNFPITHAHWIKTNELSFESSLADVIVYSSKNILLISPYTDNRYGCVIWAKLLPWTLKCRMKIYTLFNLVENVEKTTISEVVYHRFQRWNIAKPSVSYCNREWYHLFVRRSLNFDNLTCFYSTKANTLSGYEVILVAWIISVKSKYLITYLESKSSRVLCRPDIRRNFIRI